MISPKILLNMASSLFQRGIPVFKFLQSPAEAPFTYKTKWSCLPDQTTLPVYTRAPVPGTGVIQQMSPASQFSILCLTII